MLHVLATLPASALSALLTLDVLLLIAALILAIVHLRALPLRFLGLAPSPLAPSRLAAAELVLAGVFAFGGGIVFQLVAIQVGQRWFPAPADGEFGLYHVAAGAAFQLGLLAGLGHAWFWHLRPSRRLGASAAPEPAQTSPRLPWSRVLRGGFFTFLGALLVVGPVAMGWQAVLKAFGIDAPPQDLITLFTETGDLVPLALMIFLAVVIAPVTEEWVFRIGLFRWLRTRVSRSAALFLPSILFAMIHGNLAVLMPLAALAVVLSLGYEHYGHPAVPILAHAFFNLNTVALLLAGFPA